MKYRLRDVIDSLEFDELQRMKKDVESGGFHLKKFLDEKIKEETKKHERICANCNCTIDPYSTNNFTLLFGPDDFLKKATFCGPDCMEYFLRDLKEIKRVRN